MTQSISQESLVVTGKSGLTASSSYAGATVAGAPTTGNFNTGDYVVDQSGAFWICVASGIPGTWSKLGTSALASVSLTGQSAAIIPTTLYTATTSGLFTVNYYGKVTRAASNYSSLGVFNVISTDPDGSVVTTVGDVTSQNSTVSGFISGSATVYVGSGTNIQYSCGYTSNGTTTMQYNLSVAVAGGTTTGAAGWVTSFNGRSGTVTSAISDYSSYYTTISGGTLVSGTITNTTIASGTFNTPTIASGTIIGGSSVSTVLQSPLETAYFVGASYSGTQNLYVATNGSLIINGNGATGNWSFNIAATSGTTLNSFLANNQSITIVIFVYQGSPAYYCTGISIDGVAQTINSNLFWQGGVAPTTGNINGYDAYTISISKSGSGTYITFASLVKF